MAPYFSSFKSLLSYQLLMEVCPDPLQFKIVPYLLWTLNRHYSSLMFLFSIEQAIY